MTAALDRLAQVLGVLPGLGFRAPARANLIGEHTDYNGGFVLPVALHMSTFVVGRRTSDRTVTLRSLDVDGTAIIDASTCKGPDRGWGRYVTAVVRAARDEGYEVLGFDGIVASDVPIGAGLASSAAIEVALAGVLLEDDPGPLAVARMCRRAENVYCGARTGIMDQLAAAACKAGAALFIDCLDETFEPVSLPDDLSVLVIDSAVRRRLTESAYNERRAECERAVEALGVESLRHTTAGDVETAEMDEIVRRRARHVVTENDRVLKAVAALRASDFETIGELFAESHWSMSRDFQNSTPELDALVEIALRTRGVVGARMTGGGFGGCTVNLVRVGEVEDVATSIVAEYSDRLGLRARYWISRPAPGASPL